MNTFHVGRSLLLTLITGSVLVTSCKKEADTITPAATATVPTSTTTAGVNDWILGNMQYYYYWSDKIPANPDKSLSPDKFFSSLLYTYNATTNPTGDRFSWIQESADDLKASLSGVSKTDGLEFKLYLRSSTGDDIVGKVLYVLKGSPAEKAGLARGDIFYQVNGQTLTRANYYDLVYGASDTKTYTLAKIDGTSIVNTTTTKQTTPIVFQANPVYLDSVYTVGSKKVGYFVYNQFVTGPSGPNDRTYDTQVDNVFAKFKAQGVTDLILDFRYNPGGYVSSAQNLASLIGKGIDASKIFYRQEYNKQLTEYYQTQKANAFNGYFVQKASNIGNSLNNLIVLTTNGTASASELVINGLKPYMPVTIIGTTTYGKNVGSFTISDDKGRYKWGMQPIVTKSFNSLNQSDYSTGFTPTIEVKEYTNEVWRQLGDTRETMLSTALAQISGSARVVTQSTAPTYEVSSSIERKAGGSNMFFNGQLPVLP
ncbi:S41 family peptidase [Spirosoma sp. KUDC1026]|uniref:S41 family peptidase n=1 Tax=Spirosoma sp. KUDC1026 TaxID=2745947 RepID=UPI00159B9218|nr:S41 family peptidase [Spirosoma sp. KUDC1026]QKZ11299.1 peptidase S41 [Spirosoma sp. KUDC1026]